MVGGRWGWGRSEVGKTLSALAIFFSRDESLSFYLRFYNSNYCLWGVGVAKECPGSCFFFFFFFFFFQSSPTPPPPPSHSPTLPATLKIKWSLPSGLEYKYIMRDKQTNSRERVNPAFQPLGGFLFSILYLWPVSPINGPVQRVMVEMSIQRLLPLSVSEILRLPSFVLRFTYQSTQWGHAERDQFT